MARPVKRGPSPVLVVVLVLVVLAIGGGVAVWVLRPQLPFGLSVDLPEVPKIEVPREIPFDLPWEKEGQGNDQEADNEEVDNAGETSSAVAPDGSVATEAPVANPEGNAAIGEGSAFETVPGEVVDTEAGPIAENPESVVETAEVVQGEGEAGVVEEVEPAAPAQAAPEVAGGSAPLVTPDL